MPHETFALWREAIANLGNPEMAEMAVVAVWKEAKGPRPNIADIIERFEALCRAEEMRTPMLPLPEVTRPNTSSGPWRDLLGQIGSGRSIGGDSAYGKVCRVHNRWVGTAQNLDPCWPHVHGDKVPA